MAIVRAPAQAAAAGLTRSITASTAGGTGQWRCVRRAMPGRAWISTLRKACLLVKLAGLTGLQSQPRAQAVCTTIDALDTERALTPPEGRQQGKVHFTRGTS